MKDFQITLDNEESAKVNFWQDEIPSTLVDVFLWAKSKDRLSISINVEGKEKCVIEVSDRGHRIEVEKLSAKSL